ncbi:arginyl-tRNA--protein transferase 1-like isoform X2 [Ischnura elegans]|uniref:arginyl-tRNA--protein transferase 1-like isoform X2 n=1 Tax=Ischnura elegans TaxID=197161 RepID=UPI001ED8AE93|nr:arginyl-tRNA--protein transferase 1-like isoform X2 [Ischnura elegans]
MYSVLFLPIPCSPSTLPANSFWHYSLSFSSFSRHPPWLALHSFSSLCFPFFPFLLHKCLQSVLNFFSTSTSLADYESADELPPHLALAQSQPAVIDYDKIEVDVSPSKEGITSKEVINSRMEVEGFQSVPGNESKRKSTINKEETTQLHGKKFSHAVSAAGPSTEEQGQNAAGTTEDHPKPKKAKLIRLENKYNKLIKRGMSHEDASQLTYANKNSVQKTSSFDYDSYFPREEEMSSFALRFKTELVSVSDLKMDEVLLHKTHKLYEKYQMAVHDDSPEDCSIKQLTRFLIDSPIYDSQPGEGPPCGFGSFHEQYWVGDRLIAVGVIDILPKCISSVYFFYDPELRFLSLGTYGCLREIFSTRSLMKVYPPIKYYYLGFYLHSCPKMAYKGKYVPSYLLCPETFTWHPIEKCRPLLDKSKYSRFETDLRVENALKCEVNLEKVGILYKRQLMSYHTYKKINYAANDEGKVKEYARLVGKDTYHSLFLYRD